jgi:hypothetical protein
MFLDLLLRIVASLDKSLGDTMPSLDEERIGSIHEDQIQLSLGPSGIGEVGIDNQEVHMMPLIGGPDIASRETQTPFCPFNAGIEPG